MFWEKGGEGMRCPWCGRPVTIHGSQWECYWCKDFGTVQKKPAPPPAQTPQITFTVSVVYHFDLSGRFSELKAALRTLAPRQEALSALLGKVLLYTISLANRRKGGLFDEEKTEQLRAFLEEVPDAVPGENADALVRRAGQEVVFAEEGALSKKSCGTFWSMLISLRMPQANDAEDEPESLTDLFLGLCSIYNHFGGFEGWDYEYALRAAFCTQLSKRAMPQPKAPAARPPQIGQKSQQRATSAEPQQTVPKDDGSIFPYCLVEIEGISRTYAYLRGALQLAVGDAVEVPLGKEDSFRRGYVKAVMDCTRSDAPWPPERTKTVLRKADFLPRPQAEQKAEPKPQPRPVRQQPPSPANELQTDRLTQKAEPPAPTHLPKAKAQTASRAASVKKAPEPTEQKEKPPVKKIVAAALAGAVLLGSIAALAVRDDRQSKAYQAALTALSGQDYAAAEQGFAALSGYRDAASLSVYCKYVQLYGEQSEYMGGAEELKGARLRYNTEYQAEIDALAARASEYKAEKEAAEKEEQQRLAAEEAKKRERELIAKYAGKLPVDGMPTAYLKYTALGAPTKIEECQDYNHKDYHKRYRSFQWLNAEEQIVATCQASVPKGTMTEVIYAFKYHNPPVGRPKSAPPWTPPASSGKTTDDYHDGYDSPEDLYDDNPDWFDDEDEAWAEWEDG